MQGGQAIRGPSTASAGGTIEVEVGSSSKSIDVNLGGPNETQTLPVPTNGKVTFPIPPGAGPWLTVSIGVGLDRKYIRIEIISPSP